MDQHCYLSSQQSTLWRAGYLIARQQHNWLVARSIQRLKLTSDVLRSFRLLHTASMFKLRLSVVQNVGLTRLSSKQLCV